MIYLVVFFAALVIDVIPVFSPPAWTAMVFLMLKFDLNPWLVIILGVTGSSVGRYIMSLYIPKVSHKIMKQHKNEDLQYLGKKLGQKNWQAWGFVLIYTLMPLPTTALFTATGIARINPLQIIPPFFVGKLCSDALMIFTGKYAASSGLFSDLLSPKGIITAVIGLALIFAILFIDWHVLLQKKQLRFNFRIWK